MKKTLLGIFCCLLVLNFTSCLSLGLSPLLANPKTDIPFIGAMDTHTGYENLFWGTSYTKVKEAGYPLAKPDEDSVNFSMYFIGKSERVWNDYSKKYYNRITKYGHGEVNQTKLFFNYNKLFGAEDSFLTTPSMDYLHGRYGEFSEINVVTEEQKANKIAACYTNSATCEILSGKTLTIEVYENGTCVVTMFEEYTLWSFSLPSIEIKDKNYATAQATDKVQPNVWYCYAKKDPLTQKVDLTFLNQNQLGKYLFIGYEKDPKSPTLSTVRAGICWRNNTAGTYEIKLGTNITKKNYSSKDWNCLYNDKKYTYTYNLGESAREMVVMFLENQKITVRHNEEVCDFFSDGSQLAGMMAGFGVSLDEISAAIANEEF